MECLICFENVEKLNYCYTKKCLKGLCDICINKLQKKECPFCRNKIKKVKVKKSFICFLCNKRKSIMNNHGGFADNDVNTTVCERCAPLVDEDNLYCLWLV